MERQKQTTPRPADAGAASPDALKILAGYLVVAIEHEHEAFALFERLLVVHAHLEATRAQLRAVLDDEHVTEIAMAGAAYWHFFLSPERRLRSPT
jgi:hypothetical protein